MKNHVYSLICHMKAFYGFSCEVSQSNWIFYITTGCDLTHWGLYKILAIYWTNFDFLFIWQNLYIASEILWAYIPYVFSDDNLPLFV